MMRVLLTGGSGFVGRNLQEYFSHIHDLIIDAPSSKELDVLKEEQVREWLLKKHYDVVLHFAVYTDAIDKTKDGSRMLDYNLLSFMNFYKYRHYYGRMFYSGSGAEFNKKDDIVCASESVIEYADSVSECNIPTDPYGLMKYTIGRLIDVSDNIYNVRIFGLFGKYEYDFRFITDMCNKSIKGEPFVVNQNVYFDYLYIDDFCRMMYELMAKDILKYHSYNMVSGVKISLLEICNIINNVARSKGRSASLVSVKKEGLNKEYTASNSRFLEEIPGFEYTSIEDAIDKYYEFLLVKETR